MELLRSEITHTFAFDTDSSDYEMLFESAKDIVGVEGMSCEIGLRRGGGSAHIMQALSETGQSHRLHIAIDPYGNIVCAANDQVQTRFDYTNAMRDQCLIDMYLFSRITGISFQFFCLEDVEFFNRYADGIPVYNEFKLLINKYALVHFDGPHATDPIMKEFIWFNARAPKGAIFIFDDTPFYDHERLERELILPAGWTLFRRGDRKASYRKQA